MTHDTVLALSSCAKTEHRAICHGWQGATRVPGACAMNERNRRDPDGDDGKGWKSRFASCTAQNPVELPPTSSQVRSSDMATRRGYDRAPRSQTPKTSTAREATLQPAGTSDNRASVRLDGGDRSMLFSRTALPVARHQPCFIMSSFTFSITPHSGVPGTAIGAVKYLYVTFARAGGTESSRMREHERVGNRPPR